MYVLVAGEANEITQDSLLAFLHNLNSKTHQIRENDAIAILNYSSLKSFLAFKRFLTPIKNV